MFNFSFFFFLAMLLSMLALVLQPGIEFMPSVLEAQSLNPWTAKEVPMFNFLHKNIYGKLYICGISRYFYLFPLLGKIISI